MFKFLAILYKSKRKNCKENNKTKKKHNFKGFTSSHKVETLNSFNAELT